MASAPTVTRSVRSGTGTDSYDSGVSTDDRGWVSDDGHHTVRLDWRSGASIATGVFVVLVAVAFFGNVPDSLTRIAMGVLLAFALDPVVIRIKTRFRCSRGAAVTIVGTSVAAVFALIVLIVGPSAVDQAERFGRELPETVEDLYDLPLVGGWLDDADAAKNVQEWVAELPARVDTRTVTQTARNLLDGVVAGLVVILVGLAVLVDGERLVRRIKALVPAQLEPRAVVVGRIFYRTIGAYFAGSLLVALLAATFILVVGLAVGVPLAPVAALWMLLVNLIPQIGGLLGGGFFVLLALSDGVGTGLLCLVLYLVYQQVENHLIQPAIVGEAVDLSAPATMLAALVGAAAAGVPGALVATPLVGATKALYLQLRWGRIPAPRQNASLWQRIRRTGRRRGAH